VREPLALLPEYLSAHVRLTLAALAAGILVAVPAGVLVSRRRSLEGPVLGLASVIQTVPALALLAAMVPLLSGLGLPGIGVLPAFLALVLYSLLPILRNTVTGLHGLDPAVREAARGVGMTESQQLWQVELPLALPVIVAGVRTATTWTVGMATLSTPVGAPSLGNYIFGGLQTRNTASILTGCIAAAALALGLDGLVRAVAFGLSLRRRAVVAGAGLGLLALAAWAWGMAPRSEGVSSSRPIVVGAKTFTEQYVLAEILAGTVEARTGRATRTLTSLGSTVAFDALRRDEIDLYVDYTGTLWATVMGRKGPGGSRREVEEEVRRWLLEEAGVTLVASLGFENAYCFAVRRETADRLGLRTLGDLARHARRLSLASDYEFFAREEWRAVEAAYGLAFRERRTMDPSLLYDAIAARQVDAITAYSSDGRIQALGLVTLDDDVQAIPPYDAVVLASPRLAREAPDVVAALEALAGTVDVATMRALNRLVDEEGRAPAAAARAFFARRPPPATSSGSRSSGRGPRAASRRASAPWRGPGRRTTPVRPRPGLQKRRRGTRSRR
jgi:osmoprotectant transport system permease protein